MIRENKLIYLIEILWLFLLLIFASLSYLNQEHISFFFNADILGFFDFFQDMFLKHVHYKDWSLSPAPHFFPDMLIFFPFLFLVKNVYYQFLISLWLMIIFTYLSIRFVYFQIFPKKQSVFFSLAVTSGFYLLALKGVSPYILALVPAVHVGEFIAGVFFIGVQLKIINQKKNNFNNYFLYILSTILAFCCGLSDLLFVTQFACAAFLAHFFLFLKNKTSFKQCVILSNITIIPAILGSFFSEYLVPNRALFEYLSHPSIKKITLNTIISQLHTVIIIFKNINFLIATYLIIFYVFIFKIFYEIIFKKFKNNFFIVYEKDHFFLISFIFFSVILSFLSIIPLCGINYVLDRYVMPFYFLSSLLFFIPLFSINHKNIVSKISNAIVYTLFFSIIFSTITLASKPGFRLKENYYPEDLRCIDKALHNQGHDGIAQYWTARPFSMLSKENLKINQVLPNLDPFLRSANIGKHKNSYSFAIIDIYSGWILDQNLIENINGKPKQIVLCGDKKLLIYPKHSLKVKKELLNLKD